MDSNASGRSDRIKNYVRSNLDEILITGSLAKLAFDETAAWDSRDDVVLAAFRRSHPSFSDASVDEIGDHLADLDEDQIAGVVANVKGVAHEIVFVEIENDDGDAITASLFSDINHKDYDIVLHDSKSGATWEAQLKATDSESYVESWVASHPNGEILVTEELAQKMGLPSSGVSNAEITTDVEQFVDRVIDDDTLLDYVPALSLVSISVVVYALYKRWRAGEISKQRFLKLASTVTGWKVAKITALALLLSVPGVNIAVGAAIIAKLLVSGRRVFDHKVESPNGSPA